MVQRTDLPRDTAPRQLFADQTDKNRLEVRNGLLQFDEVIRLVGVALETGTFRLTADTIRSLHYFAIHDIYSCAGNYRTGPISISNTVHQPPPHTEAPGYVDDMCAYVNDNWNKSAMHLSAFVMWRLNWIHPFAGGNGRSSRAVSYLVLCTRIRQRLDGTLTIPEQIEADSRPYYSALDAADLAWSNGTLDVSAMEQLLNALLAKQLLSTHTRASESDHPPATP